MSSTGPLGPPSDGSFANRFLYAYTHTQHASDHINDIEIKDLKRASLHPSFCAASPSQLATLYLASWLNTSQPKAALFLSFLRLASSLRAAASAVSSR